MLMPKFNQLFNMLNAAHNSEERLSSYILSKQTNKQEKKLSPNQISLVQQTNKQRMELSPNWFSAAQQAHCRTQFLGKVVIISPECYSAQKYWHFYLSDINTF